MNISPKNMANPMLISGDYHDDWIIEAEYTTFQFSNPCMCLVSGIFINGYISNMFDGCEMKFSTKLTYLKLNGFVFDKMFVSSVRYSAGHLGLK